MSVDSKNLISDSLELASLPAVVMRAMDLLNDPNTSASDIGNVISEDPALTMRLLKIVNSAFYGFPSRIETVSRAITIIGTLELTDLIVGSSVVNTFANLPNKLVNMEQFWRHSLYSGIVTKLLARRLRAPHTERCFVLGLLHDIGALVLYRQWPEKSCQALELSASGELPLHLAEQRVFGFDHGAIGAELMQQWKLPESFMEVARHHHQPLKAERYRLETATVHLADVIADRARASGSNTPQATPLQPDVWEITGLPMDIIEPVTQEADALFEEARAVILPSPQAA